jgi:hypothetical protein
VSSSILDTKVISGRKIVLLMYDADSFLARKPGDGIRVTPPVLWTRIGVPLPQRVHATYTPPSGRSCCYEENGFPG